VAIVGRPKAGKGAPPRWAHGQTAPFACDPNASRGRLHQEAESAARTPFERDRDRVIHSSAFRFLKGKTQVFVSHEGDYFRTRLTHSLEVAQIARSLARQLGLDPDLAETCGLAHDLGHPPFGHTGEDVLKACMAEFGGFDHNAQTLKVLTSLERSYPRFDGLNLTWETLEGVVKHNGPLVHSGSSFDDLPEAIRAYAALHDLGLHTWPSAEAQTAALADDIAYNNHDIDDGLHSGLFSLEALRAASPLVDEHVQGLWQDYPDLDPTRQRKELVRRLIGAWVDDLVQETSDRIARLKPRSPDDVRALGEPLVGFSEAMLEEATRLRRFLMANMYRHWKVNRRRAMAKRIVKELFQQFQAEPGTLPGPWQEGAADEGSGAVARRICDYIAGMTDDFAIEEHRRLFSFDRT
jgi:dGTPase